MSPSGRIDKLPWPLARTYKKDEEKPAEGIRNFFRALKLMRIWVGELSVLNNARSISAG
jgi:hypothetical protein